MCLYTNSKEFKVAEEPITVYKYVAKKYEILDGEHKGEMLNIDALHAVTLCMSQQEKPVKAKPVFVSPYYPSAKVVYSVGETIKDDTFQTAARETYSGSSVLIVEHGLHTSECSKDADRRAEGFVPIDYETAVLRCTIPAGARYYEGDGEYCSDTLVVEEVMREYECTSEL